MLLLDKFCEPVQNNLMAHNSSRRSKNGGVAVKAPSMLNMENSEVVFPDE